MKMENNNNFELQEAFDLFDTDGDGQVIDLFLSNFEVGDSHWIKVEMVLMEYHFIDISFNIFSFR